MSRNQVNTAVLVCEEAELAVVPGAGLVAVKDAKIGPEVLHVAALKSRVVIGVARISVIRIA
jgi:hypothetical protein